jgi:hypothetical protein
MKYLSLGILILMTGCTGSGMNIYLQDYPEWNWVDQTVFMHNVRTCRSMDYCAAEQLFDR